MVGALSGYTWAIASVPVLAWLSSVALTSRSVEYEAFVNGLPITRTCQASFCTLVYGRRRAAAPPALIDRFDWVVGHQGIGSDGHAIPRKRRGRDPRTVFASPNQVRKVLHLARKSFDAAKSSRVLVLSGAPELTVSEAFGDGESCVANSSACASTIAQLRDYFDAIFFEGKDIAVDGVLAYPGGLNELYLRGGGTMEIAAAAMSAANIDFGSKPRSVLAAWGAVWNYIENIEEGKMLHYAGPKMAWGRIKLEAGRSRRLAREWSMSTAARGAGVELRSIPSELWWIELSKYRFLLSPLGTSIYSPKTVEALMVFTVPIVRRGPFQVHDDMLSYGFPIVVIDEWDQITSESLDLWWNELSPRLARFRHNCLTTEGYWRILTGVTHFCQ